MRQLKELKNRGNAIKKAFFNDHEHSPDSVFKS